MMVVAPALAAGNTVVVKPSEVTSASMLEVAALATEAGFPPGGSTPSPATARRPRRLSPSRRREDLADRRNEAGRAWPSRPDAS